MNTAVTNFHAVVSLIEAIADNKDSREMDHSTVILYSETILDNFPFWLFPHDDELLRLLIKFMGLTTSPDSVGISLSMRSAIAEEILEYCDNLRNFGDEFLLHKWEKYQRDKDADEF